MSFDCAYATSYHVFSNAKFRYEQEKHSSSHQHKSNYDSVDQRRNIHELPVGLGLTQEQRIKTQVESVACLVFKHLLDQTDNGWSINATVPKLHQRLEIQFGCKFGEEELFRNEPCLGFGTTFLIGKRLALTAGHCVAEPTDPSDHSSKWILSSKKINNLALVFGFQTFTNEEYQKNFDAEDVYGIADVVAYRKDLKEDWAVVMLDREVENRTPLSLNFSDFVSSQNSPQVYMLGHPSGLPTKFAGNAVVKKSSEEHSFEANLDAFKGNSGSPIFNKNGEVIGILVRGNYDYWTVSYYKETGQKRVCVKQTTEAEIQSSGYEGCQRISSMVFLKGIFLSINIPRMIGSPVPKGLSLIGKCKNQSCNDLNGLIVIPVGNGFGNFNLAKVADKSSCPNCDARIPFTSINTMVLASCKYQIEGQNAEEVDIRENCQLRKEMQFKIAGWRYIELNVKQLA